MKDSVIMKLDILTKQVVNLTRSVGYFIKNESEKYRQKTLR